MSQRTEVEQVIAEILESDTRYARAVQIEREQKEAERAELERRAAELRAETRKPLLDQAAEIETVTTRLVTILEGVANEHPSIKDQQHVVIPEFHEVPFDDDTGDIYRDGATITLRWGKLEPTTEEKRLMGRRVSIRRGPEEIATEDYSQITVRVDGKLIRFDGERSGDVEPTIGANFRNFLNGKQSIGHPLARVLREPLRVVTKVSRTNGYRPQ